MGLAIWGFGTALPACSITQERAAELTSLVCGHTEAQARRLSALYRRTGIRTRHVALIDTTERPPDLGGDRGPTTRERMKRYNELVRPLAMQAAARALDGSGVAPGEVTHLISVSCTGFAAPGFDLALIRDLALRPTLQRTHIGFMGCHGALNGLRVARAFAESDRSARVLLCAAELCSLHFQQGWDADLAVSNALFADGAAALVGSVDPAEPGPAPAWRLAASGSCLVPETEDAMGWSIGDHGFEMTLSPRVAQILGEHLRPWLLGWLDRQGLDLANVASWAVHPGGPRILDTVEEALGLGREATAASREVLASCGNMSSPTVLFILDRLCREGARTPCVALAFGPGLVIEAALFG